jgi:cell division protein FtsI (penicillin-binding protein 3)
MGLFRQEEEPIQKWEIRRVHFLRILFIILILTVLFRTYTFQVWKREPWKDMALLQYEHRVKLVARRGVIYDRKMNIFAMDLPIFSVALDPDKVKNFQKTSVFLSEVLGGESRYYLDILKSNQDEHFVRIKNDLDEEEKVSIFGSQLPGLVPIKERKRRHTFEGSALSVLGIVNKDNKGVGGIEQYLDAVLRGEDGWAIYQKDAHNRNYLSLDYPVEPPKNGNHVVLTLDHALQAIVEEELKRGVALHNAKAGCAVLIDPFMGEVLAMSSVLGREAGKEQDSFQQRIQNRTLQLAVEPGSVFKIVVAAAALEDGVFKSSSRVFCENGAYPISSNHTIHDHDKAYGWLTLSEVLEYSSNIGITKIGQTLGKMVLFKYARDFGFGNKTRIGLPGESAGLLPPVYLWTDFSTATTSFGQGISVTPLQLAGMISVIANGGELVKPRIVRSILDESGKIKKIFNRQVIRRVISEESAYKLRTILENVIINGTGKKARVEGVRIAGKTGTAQKSVPGVRGYLPGTYVSSFIGFWPAEAPMFALVVVLDEPQHEYSGSQSAAPIFARIVKKMVGLPRAPWIPKDTKQAYQGRGKFVFSSIEELNRKTANTGRPKSIESPYHLPDLVGLSMGEALQELGERGIEAHVEGNGVVVKQNPVPGKKIEKSMVCQLICQ